MKCEMIGTYMYHASIFPVPAATVVFFPPFFFFSCYVSLILSVSEEVERDIILLLLLLRDRLKCQEGVREREIINGGDSAFTNVSVCSCANRE